MPSRHAIAAILICLVLSPGVTWAEESKPKPTEKTAEKPAEGVAFVDGATPTFTIANGKLTGTLFVANASARSRKVSVRIWLRSAVGVDLGSKTAPEIEVPPGATVAPLSFKVDLPDIPPDGFPLSGWLVLEEPHADPKVPPIKQEIKSIAGPITPPGQEWPIVFHSLFYAVAAISLAALIAIGMENVGLKVLTYRMGSPSFSFTDSFSSTITLAGGTVTSLLAFSGLPDQGHALSKKTYGFVSLLLAGLIVIAPGIYNLIRTKVLAKNDAGQPVAQMRGYVALFLLAALFTLTGVLAQLGLLQLLFDDVQRVGILAPSTAWFFAALCLALRVGLWVSAIVSIVTTISALSWPVAAAARADKAAATDVKAPMPDWPLL